MPGGEGSASDEPQRRRGLRPSGATSWSEHLAAWAIPEEILAAAPESPYGFSVEVFSRIADRAITGPLDPAGRVVAEALPEGGTIVDVGCGAGAASLPHVATASRIIGVDASPGLLEAFAERADAAGVDHVEIHGTWPAIAAEVPAADVVVCRHVAYNLPDLAEALRRMTDLAGVRAVLHLTTEHPLAWVAPYWKRLHGVTRPDRPTVDDAVAVARGVGVEVEVERWQEPLDLAAASEEHQLGFLRRRLCLDGSRDPELRDALVDLGIPENRPVATLSWPGTG
jgi:SAM-dependent methyltransferase